MINSLEHYDKAFESKIRLQVMSVLAVHEHFEFSSFKELLEVTDGNLATHLRHLEKLGYIKAHKQFVGRKPNTTYKATNTGKKAFSKHLEALELIIKRNH